MIYLYGCPVPEQDARTLIARLRASTTPDAIEAAEQIEQALELDRVMAGLSPDHRTAVLDALSDAPSGLVGLHGALARDHARRAAAEAPSSGPAPTADAPFRVILIDENRKRQSFLVDLDDPPRCGEPVELPHGTSAVVHHVTSARQDGIAGVIIAGPTTGA